MRKGTAAALAAAVVFAAVVLTLKPWERARRGPHPIDPAQAERAEALVRAACSSCHVFPPPEILPRAAWPHSIRTMFQIAEARSVALPLPFEQAAAWYMLRAPERLAPAAGRTDAGPGPIVWRETEWVPPAPPPGLPSGPGVTHVRIAPLFGGRALDVIISDAPSDGVYAWSPSAPDRDPLRIGRVARPGRVEVVDLDGNGAVDVVVASLGRMQPTSERVGAVVWLRRTGPETFEEIVLADDLGRVADVRAADVTGNGRTDLLVAVFGWRENGGLLLLENVGDDEAGRPRFTERVLDDRSGFTDVRAVDLNGDGRLEVVALLAQQWQEVVAFAVEDDDFRTRTLYAAPHPDWGFTGLEAVDFTGNGLPDLVVTNGDGLDVTVAKPHHGVGLLENQGDGRFEYRHLTHIHGAYRAVPIELAGGGGPGLLVGAYVPPSLSQGVPEPPEAIVWLERVGPTHLLRRVLSRRAPRHMALAAGDVTGDGRPDFAVGWMDLGFADPEQAEPAKLARWVSLWRNQGAGDDPPGNPEAPDVIDWRPPR